MATTSVRIRRRLGVEQLLGPTLTLVSEAGSLRTKEIVRRLGQKGLLSNASPDVSANILSEVGQTVVDATIALSESGLLESEAGEWRITAAGLRLVGKRQAVTFEMLRKRRSYKDYLKRLSAEKHRRDWQELRFDYYAAGRELTFEGSAHAGPTVLGYALEYSLKAALTELQGGLVPRSLLKGDESHNFRKLYRFCREHDLLTDTFISDDFLEYARHHFQRRYPSGQKELLRDRRSWTFGTSDLATYDDCIIQLERGLDKLYGSSTWSLGNRALTANFGSRLARAFFHDNVFAVDRLSEYRASTEDWPPSYPQSELDRPELVFSSGEHLPHPRATYQQARELLALDLAALFLYTDAEAPNPDPARTYLRAKPTLEEQSSDYFWILKRLREAFGSPAVEVVEDRDAGSALIIVYDRRAKHYWAPLEVSRGRLPILIRNEESKLRIERWILRTRELFASELRNLRLPSR